MISTTARTAAGACRRSSASASPLWRRALARALGVVVLPCLLAGQAAGCGGDDEAAQTAPPARPELTVPGERPRPAAPARDRERRSSTATAPSQAPTATADEPPSSTAPAPTMTQPPDGPSNDTPPAPGSAADRFEQACRENPAACR